MILDRPPVFGVFLVEGASPLAEADLAFLDVVASQLSITLSRHYAWQREVILRQVAQTAHARAEAANQRYEGLLAMVAHDLRNPLTSILLNADFLSRTMSGSNLGIERIRLAAERMNDLIGDLLDWAQIQAGHFVIEKQRLAMAALADEVIEMLQPLATQRGLHLSHAIRPTLPDVWAERGRMLQVLSNLIGNAIKFTPSGGTITLHAEIRASDVCVLVRDNGPGIPPDQQDHVFDRFWQATATTRKGAGLGLAIVKGIIDALDGRLWVESTLDVGSTFCFTLPIAGTRDCVSAA